jgi:hypothetical protein
MTTERWQQVKEILAAALERETGGPSGLSQSGLHGAIAAA